MCELTALPQNSQNSNTGHVCGGAFLWKKTQDEQHPENKMLINI